MLGFLAIFSSRFLGYLGIVLQDLSPLLSSCLFKLAVWLLCKVKHLQTYFSLQFSKFSHSFRMSFVTWCFFVGQCCQECRWLFRRRSVETVDQSAFFGVLVVKNEEWNKLSSCRWCENFCNVGVLPCLWSLPVSAVGELLVFVMLTLDWKCRLTMM